VIHAITFDTSVFFDRLFHPDSAHWWAMWKVVYISVIAQTVGTIFGTVLALWGMSRFVVLRSLAFAYTLLFRGTPVIIQIFFIYLSANIFLGFDLFPREVDLGFSTVEGAVIAGIVALSLNESAYMAEISRAGINSIDRGQFEAGLTVGMRRGQVLRRIVLPQAARVMVPGLGNEFNNMLKTTSLLAFIGVYELFQDAQVAISTSYQPTEIFAAVAVWYLILTSVWTLIQVQIERRLGISDRAESESWLTRIFGISPDHRVNA
jgi:polar amino acid transport system permease protein